MTQYAYFDSTVPAPSPVLGWYDTEAQPAINLVPVTPAQWANRTIGFYAINKGRLVPYTPPPTSDWEIALNAHLAQGINVISTGTPLLNANYALDGLSTSQIFQIGLYAAQFSVFTNGGSFFPYPDSAGDPHIFAVADFINFFHAVAQLVDGINTQAQIMKNGGTPSWPSNNVTIA